MLSAQNRMRSGSDFTVAVRQGRRVGKPSLVVHCVTSASVPAPRVGFIVPKSVGTSVVRNRVQRRLRHLMRDRVAGLPTDALVVVRAQPAAATTADLESDLDRALTAVLRPQADSVARRRGSKVTS